MRFPTIQGVIDRRILVNYRINPDVAARVLPEPFRPKVLNGYAIGGICLIRLKNIRPRGAPSWVGLTSENAAHRYAVEWEQGGKIHEGVYIPRRDTSSRLNVLVGRRFFPGEHHHVSFEVKENHAELHIRFHSDDDGVGVSVAARIAEEFPTDSVFQEIEVASRFF